MSADDKLMTDLAVQQQFIAKQTERLKKCIERLTTAQPPEPRELIDRSEKTMDTL